MDHLLLIDDGIGPEQLRRHLPADAAAGRAVVLAESEALREAAERAEASFRAVADFFPPSGRADGETFGRALEMARRIFSSGAVARHLERAGAGGAEEARILERHAASSVLDPVLRRIGAIQRVLESDTPGRVTILSSRGGMVACFRAASPDFRGKVEEFALAGGRSPVRRLREAAGRVSGGRVGLGADLLPLLAPRSRRAGATEGIRVLVCSRPVEHDLYLETLAPLLRELAGRGGARLLDLPWNPLANRLQRHAIPALPAAEVLDRAKVLRLARGADRIVRTWRESERDPALAQSLEQDGMGLGPILARPLRNVLTRELLRLRLVSACVSSALERLQPRLLLVCPDQGLECEAAIAAARRLGVPSLYVQPALIADTPRYGALHADHAALIEDFSREVYLRRGVDPGRLHLTGLGRWDDLARAGSPAAREAARRRLGVGASDPLVIFAGQRGPGSEKRAMLEPLIEATRRLPGLRLFVRPHPSEGREAYARFFPETPARGDASLLPADVGLHEALIAGDLVVTGFSNVALEAAILDRCVLTINLRGEPDVIPFADLGIAAGASSSGEIATQVERLLGDDAAREELRRRREAYFARNPQLRQAGANARIAGLIEELERTKREGETA